MSKKTSKVFEEGTKKEEELKQVTSELSEDDLDDVVGGAIVTGVATGSVIGIGPTIQTNEKKDKNSSFGGWSK